MKNLTIAARKKREFEGAEFVTYCISASYRFGRPEKRVPVASEQVPVASQRVPVASQRVPAASERVPMGSESSAQPCPDHAALGY